MRWQNYAIIVKEYLTGSLRPATDQGLKLIFESYGVDFAKAGLFQQFFNSEKAGGLILICCTLFSLLLANSAFGPTYIHFWHTSLFFNLGPVHIPYRHEEWINDGLMSVFFLLVGLEIEREIYLGEISSFKTAILPVMAAAGGMIVPAVIHFMLNHGTPEQRGIGIPMATDIAFSLGVLSLLGKRVPLSVKIFLTALAIIDDLGAIIIIAIFYTSKFSLLYLGLAAAVFLILLFCNKKNFYSLWIYLPAGILLWYLLYRSGVHPTLSGVMLAFTIPFRKTSKKPPSAYLQHALHKPVNFLFFRFSRWQIQRYFFLRHGLPGFSAITVWV